MKPKNQSKAASCRTNDILVNSTGTGTLGRVAQLHHVGEPTIVDSHITIVRANAKTEPLFLGLALTGRESEIEEMAEGSTGQTELSRLRLGSLKVILPLENLQRKFGAHVAPMMQQISEKNEESNKLATLRDLLLPKLLNGGPLRWSTNMMKVAKFFHPHDGVWKFWIASMS